ncbi:MAG: hypothetical protein IT518_20205 [Burkholderiales bacterium]|nr:hypothetical protein [Burkholderiales bacterium]
MAVLFSDNFNRSDGGLGSNWTNLAYAAQIVSNQATGNSSGSVVPYWNGGTIGSGYAQCTLVNKPSSGGNHFVLTCAVNISTFNGYQFKTTDTTAQIERIDSSTPTVLGATFSAPANGDVVRFERNNSSGDCIVYYNGSPVATRNDSTYTAAGNRAAFSFNTSAAGTLDNFEVGDLDSGGQPMSRRWETVPHLGGRRRFAASF